MGANINAELEVERQGLRWVLNPSDYPQQDLFWLGEADRWDLYHARRLIQPGAVVLDVGANFGYYSMMLAVALRGEGEIHAFEPAEETFAKLARHVAINRIACIHAHRMALSDAPGSAAMHHRDGNSGAAYLEPGEEVPVSTLDQFAAEHALGRVDFIKLDVEGFEERVLRGGSGVISRFRPTMLVEVQPFTLERAGSSVHRLLDLLTSQGYELKQACRDQLITLEIRTEPGWVVNAFCVPAAIKAGGRPS